MNQKQLAALEFCNCSNPTISKVREVINTMEFNPLVSQGFITQLFGSYFTTARGKALLGKYVNVTSDGDYHLFGHNVIPACANSFASRPDMEIEVIEGNYQGVTASVLYTTETGVVIERGEKLLHVFYRHISHRRQLKARQK